MRLTVSCSDSKLKHSVALFIAHFNFCRKHSTIAQTPAQAAKITNHQWTIDELLKLDLTLLFLVGQYPNLTQVAQE
jgi:hypothetical protein